MNTTLLNPIINSPELPAYFAHLQNLIAEEAKKRVEFYNFITENDKAEFINGQMILHSPVRSIHNTVGAALHTMLNIYNMHNQLGYMGYEKIMIHLTRNSYEPDICFFLPEKAGHFEPQQMLFPAPDFVVEVLSKSTEKIDRGIKMQDYALHGVGEYWLIDPEKRIVEQYILDALTQNTFYLRKKYAIVEDIESQVISGFKIPVISIFEDSENVKVVKQILTNEIKPHELDLL